jgi:hypothetical protein
LKPQGVAPIPTREILEWAREVLHICLYADRLWIADPLEILADDRIYNVQRRTEIAVHQPLIQDPGRGLRLAGLLNYELSPLIESGTVVLYPAIQIYRRAVPEPLFGGVRSFTKDELISAWPNLYVTEGLECASFLNASYTALHRDEFEALRKSGEDVSRALGVADCRVLATLSRAKLPFFQALDAATLVKMRSEEAAFADFRTFLREMSGTLVAGLDDPRFEHEVVELESTRMTPALETLTRQIAGMTSLKSRLSEATIDFAAGALADIAIKGQVSEALLTGTMTALSKALVKLIVSREKARPAASVVYQFHTGRPFSSVF